MSDENEKRFEERTTWSPGDLKIFGPDGKEVDPSTLKAEEEDDSLIVDVDEADEGQGEAELEDGPDGPTVHVYLSEGDVE